MAGLGQSTVAVVRQPGATGLLFPGVEELLEEHEDQYVAAIRYVAGTKRMDNYRTVIDFLFCELFLDFQDACTAYYKQKGPALSAMFDAEQIERYNRYLLIAIMFARQSMISRRRFAGWDDFRRHVLSHIEQAEKEIARMNAAQQPR